MKRMTLAAGMVAAGLSLGVLTACGNDSTASGPTSNKPAEASTPSGMTADPTESTAPNPTSSPGLPATAPNSSTSVPQGYPGGTPTTKVDSKGQAYLGELKKQGITMDDDLALGTAQYICDARGKRSDADVKIWVLAVAGSGMTDAGAANAKADKIIAATRAKYC